jgi:hypothetical protein
MTDLEMTVACAKAMGLDYRIVKDNLVSIIAKRIHLTGYYEPLINDLQAMALIRKFELSIWYATDMWYVRKEAPTHIEYLAGENNWAAYDADLNRAVVTCVANMQRDKE